jgi:hypothetical protein
MIFLEKPYVSTFFKETIKANSYPVVHTEMVREFGFDEYPYLVDKEAVKKAFKTGTAQVLYTTSENAIGWIAENLSFTGLPGKIDMFKDKIKFRQMIKGLYPDFYFKAIPWKKLAELSLEGVPMPFIIKPRIGFFRMGVYKVSGSEEWAQTLVSIDRDVASQKDLYPSQVLDTTWFILEQCIEGREFAVDAYFNEEGDPVVLNILEHVFSSAQDVSDRIYMTSREIIKENLDDFTIFLKELGRVSGVKNFPVHVELRKDEANTIIPIEANPMRFGGWCTTGDLTFMAYGFNPYEYYFQQKKPDWDLILSSGTKDFFSIIVLDNSTGIKGDQIADFDYNRVLAGFETPLDLRKINYTEYPVFGFVFARTRKDNFSELNNILKSNLREFVSLKEDH